MPAQQHLPARPAVEKDRRGAAPVVVVNGSARSAPRDYTVRGADPGLFTLDGASAIVVHGATNQLVTAASPAEPGEAVVFYATGLGAVDRAQ